MSENKQNVELSLLDAGKYISAFFNNNQELINTFNAICVHMLDLDNDFIIRTNNEIIGISKHGEFYRFYILRKAGEYYIKYKNRKESEKFTSSNTELYFSYNKSCNEFFAENKDSLVTKERRKSNKVPSDTSDHSTFSKRSAVKVLDEWIPIKTKTENSLKFANTLSANIEYSDNIYNEIVELLTDACSNRDLMTECDGDIIISRILNPSTITLQKLGEKYNVTRERIR